MKPKTRTRLKGTPVKAKARTSLTHTLERELDVHREELAAQNEELRRANTALGTAKERYVQLYDGAPIAYFTLDDNATIIEANLSGARLLEASRHFLLGRSFDEMVVPSARDSFRKFRQRVIEHGSRPMHETLLGLGARRIPVRIEAARIAAVGGDVAPTETGEGMQLLLCVTDETEQRHLDEERRALEARSAESQRVESLRVLAGGVAHDVNNVLAVVLANVDFLLEKARLEHNFKNCLQEIRDVATRATQLSTQMLAYTGRGAQRKMTPHDVSDIVQAMGARLATATTINTKNMTLTLDLGTDVLMVCDSIQIQQIVLNLVTNAAESIPPGVVGKIVLRTRSEHEYESNESNAFVPNPHDPNDPFAQHPTDRELVHRVVIEVSDNGLGMDEATKQRAFDPFFTTKFAGRGLGLAVVHGNARAHSGIVDVRSRLHEGTTFRVSFPASKKSSSFVTPL